MDRIAEAASTFVIDDTIPIRSFAGVAHTVAILIFLAGSILAGMADSMTALTIYRAIQGIGAGGNFALVYIVLADISAPQDRGRMMSYASFVWGLASVLGPSLGGFIVT